MKHGKRPTAAQKKLLAQHGLNWQNWLVVKNEQDKLLIVHRHTNTKRYIPQ